MVTTKKAKSAGKKKICFSSKEQKHVKEGEVSLDVRTASITRGKNILDQPQMCPYFSVSEMMNSPV
jgi:hypothetical protein